MSLIKRTGPVSVAVDGVWKVWPIRKKEAPRLFARWHGQFGARARAAGACGALLNRGLVSISLSPSLSGEARVPRNGQPSGQVSNNLPPPSNSCLALIHGLFFRWQATYDVARR